MDTRTLKLVLYGQHLGKVLSLRISAFFFTKKKYPLMYTAEHTVQILENYESAMF